MHPDIHYLKKALSLAEKRKGFTAPNPSVGALIVKDGCILAQGNHFAAGQPHAEVEAFSSLKTPITSDMVLYVTLEPCCHWGRTPPCTDAIIKSGIKRVVYGYPDPNPLVKGKGEGALKAAGVACEYYSLPEINTFYESYFFWQQHHKPFVTAKIAMTLDAKIADKRGRPLSITGEKAKKMTHRLRQRADAILTTVKTIINDDPELNVRLGNKKIAKPLYIVDRHLAFPVSSKVTQRAKSITLFYKEGIPVPSSLSSFRCIPVKEKENVLDLESIMLRVGQDGVHDLWVEAGGQLFSRLLNEHRIQRAIFYIAPKILGEGTPAFIEIFDWAAHQVQWQSLGEDILCKIEINNLIYG